MRSLLVVVGSIAAASLVACTGASAEEAGDSAAAATEQTAPILDCTKPGSYPEEAMNGLSGSYERVGTAPSNGLQSLTVGPLEDIKGWGGKHATYTRDVAAPCTDIVAIGDGAGFTPTSPMPMTSKGCAGQTGTLTTLFDNPAIGAFIGFEDSSGLPAGKDFYFVTSSLLGADGKIAAMCLGNGATGDTFLVKRKGP